MLRVGGKVVEKEKETAESIRKRSMERLAETRERESQEGGKKRKKTVWDKDTEVMHYMREKTEREVELKREDKSWERLNTLLRAVERRPVESRAVQWSPEQFSGVESSQAESSAVESSQAESRAVEQSREQSSGPATSKDSLKIQECSSPSSAEAESIIEETPKNIIKSFRRITEKKKPELLSSSINVLKELARKESGEKQCHFAMYIAVKLSSFSHHPYIRSIIDQICFKTCSIAKV
eukprot:gene11129-20011_t